MIYYTEHLVSAVGSFDPSTHAFRDFQTPSANSNPYGIAASGSLVWFTENNSNVDRIASLNTANNAISEYPIVLPLSNSTPHLVTIGAGGNPWWTEGWSNTIATLNPAAATPGQCGVQSGTCNGIQRFQPPAPATCNSSGTHISGIAFQGSSGQVWFDNSLSAQVGSLAPSTDVFAVTTLSNCGAHPHDGLGLDSAGNVWFDEEFANAIGELIPGGSAAAPTVATQPASAVGQTSATLNATVNPNGAEVSECKFEYGASTAYGSSVPCTPAPGSGSSTVSVSGTVSALSANAIYHFRIVATNAGGSTAGADQTFTTLPLPFTFGKTSIGASSDTYVEGRKRVNRYALSEAGSVNKLTVYIAKGTASGSQVMKGIIYSDSGGAPSALLGQTEQLTFSSTQAAGWYDLPLASPLKLVAANYWIGVITGSTSRVIGYRYDKVTGSEDFNENLFSSGPTNPFGSVRLDTRQMSLYATYSPG